MKIQCFYPQIDFQSLGLRIKQKKSSNTGKDRYKYIFTEIVFSFIIHNILGDNYRNMTNNRIN